MTIVSWLAILVMCICGWISYTQRAEMIREQAKRAQQLPVSPHQHVYVIHNYQNFADLANATPGVIVNPPVQPKKPTIPISYDDPQRSITVK